MNLEWNSDGDATTDGAWVIQTERGLHEPPYRSVMTAPPGFWRWVETTDLDTGWYCGPKPARRHVEALAARFATSRVPRTPTPEPVLTRSEVVAMIDAASRSRLGDKHLALAVMRWVEDTR